MLVDSLFANSNYSNMDRDFWHAIRVEEWKVSLCVLFVNNVQVYHLNITVNYNYEITFYFTLFSSLDFNSYILYFVENIVIFSPRYLNFFGLTPS